MKRLLIAGVGNVLLGDDGVGPYIVQQLKSRFEFSDGVEVEDLGTPALDTIDYFAGRDALIVIDSVENGKTPGTITPYRKADLIRHAPAMRMDPHSPALSESLLMADLLGHSPADVLLVGVSGASYEAGCGLSAAMQDAIESVIAGVLRELDRLGIRYSAREHANTANLWWLRRTEAASLI